MLDPQARLLHLILKVAGYRRSYDRRRSKNWSQAAQTMFASWAVVGQLTGIGLLVAELSVVESVKADITDIPGYQSCQAGFAIGGLATAAKEAAYAIGYRAAASGFHSQAMEHMQLPPADTQ